MGEWRYRSKFFLFLALAGGEWSASPPGRFTPGERATCTHWLGGLVNPRAGLDDLEKRKFLTLPGFELRPVGRPARSQSLYRLRYAGSYIEHVGVQKQFLDSDMHIINLEKYSFNTRI
jgi:hypothetical protein